ncbi:MAG TPA: hypothetical protein VIU11_24810 [Nakamurella sp.]
MWTIAGPDTGSVLDLAFSGVEQITGAPNDADEFVFGPAGSMTGAVVGGAGGGDGLRPEGTGTVPTATVSFLPNTDGAGGGAVRIGATTIRYAGIDQVVSDWIDDAVSVALGQGATVSTEPAVLIRSTTLNQLRSTAHAETGPSDLLSVAAPWC